MTARQEGIYRKLRGSGRGSFGIIRVARQRLWLGPDHVLLVNNSGYSESYKRFYFPDIQAVLVRNTVTGKIWNALLLLAVIDMGAFGIAALMFDWPPPSATIFWIASGFFAVCFLVNWGRGPTCASHVRTAVQTERIYALNRTRNAMAFIEALREYVHAEQGVLTPERAERGNAVAVEAAREAEAAAAAMPQPSGTTASYARPIGAPVPVVPYRSHAHEVLFGVLLLDVCHSCLRFFTGGIPMFLASLLLGIAIMVSIVTALIKQNGTDLSRGVKNTTWLALAYLVVTYMVGFTMSMVFSATHPETAGNSWEHMRAASSISPFESPAEMTMLVFSTICSAVLGFTGLVLLDNFRKRSSTPPPVVGSETPASSPGR